MRNIHYIDFIVDIDILVILPLNHGIAKYSVLPSKCSTYIIIDVNTIYKIWRVDKMEHGAFIFGGIFAIIYFLVIIGFLIGYVIIIKALWRGMLAHESIAETLKKHCVLERSNSSASD
jgi:hypothetical protein